MRLGRKSNGIDFPLKYESLNHFQWKFFLPFSLPSDFYILSKYTLNARNTCIDEYGSCCLFTKKFTTIPQILSSVRFKQLEILKLGEIKKKRHMPPSLRITRLIPLDQWNQIAFEQSSVN